MFTVELANTIAQLSLNARGFHSRLKSTDLGRLHFYDAKGEGDLPPMVILHGIASGAMSYAPLFTQFRKHSRRIIAPEGIGHGHSEDPKEALTPQRYFGALNELLISELTEPGIVIGNSLGGAAAVRFALNHPELAKALILISPAGAETGMETLDNLRGDLLFENSKDSLRFVEQIFHKPPWYKGQVAKGTAYLMGKPAPNDLLRYSTEDDQFTPEEVKSLTMPVLFIWGKSERLLPDEHLAYYKEHLHEKTVFEEPDHYGHVPHIEYPRHLGRMILDYARVYCK